MADLSDARPYLDLTLQQFPILSPLFIPEREENWQCYLDPYGQFSDALAITPLNFLTAAIGAGWEIKHPGPNALIAVLTSLSRYLQAFDYLLLDKKFKDKLLNLKGWTFLNTLSELSIAYRLQSAGYSVSFEEPFRQQNKKTDNDVDIKVIGKDFKHFYLEVYNPNQVADDGFIDFLDQKDTAFKVERKLVRKFGFGELAGLQDGLIFLAVNTAYVDHFRAGFRLAMPLLQQELERFIDFLPAAVDGYIFFDDDFTSDFVFEGLFMRP